MSAHSALSPELRSGLRRASSSASWLAIALSTAAVIGPFAGLPELTGGTEHWPKLEHGAAVTCILAAVALRTGTSAEGSWAPRRGTRILVGFVLFLSLVLLARDLVHWPGLRDLPWLAGIRLDDGPGTLTSLSLVGIAAAMRSRPERPRRRITQACIVTVILVSALALIGYACAVPNFHTWHWVGPRDGISLPGAIALAGLGVGYACARHDLPVVQVLTDSTPGGTVARQLLIVPVAIPLLTGLAVVALTRLRMDPGLVGWLFAMTNIMAFTGSIAWISVLLHREELRRRSADAELRALNASLEDRVASRTRELREEVEARHRAAEALRRSEEHFRSLVQDSSDLIAVVRAGGLLEFISDNVQRILGTPASALIGRSVIDRVHPEDAGRLRRILEYVFSGRVAPGGRLGTQTFRFAHAEGAWRSFELAGRLLIHDASEPALIVNARDITERLALQAQLLHAQKLDSIGRLAGGIAHDFNNILTVIQGHVALCRIHRALDPATLESLDEIALAATRAANLTRQLLVFSSRQPIRPTVLDLSEVVNGMVRMLGRTLRENISLQVVTARDLPRIYADRGMIEQILLNLAVNARDAMPDGGRLTIETRLAPDVAVAVDGEPGAGRANSGNWVSLSVSDTGCGIPRENLPRIFEPFFTTKKLGEGTGLGLATVHGIVRQHNAFIDVHSTPGAGTTFHVYFPPTDRRARPVVPERGDSRIARPRAPHRRSVILVEDEAPLRRLVREALEQQGYQVTEFESAAAALQEWNRAPLPIDALITDVVTPGGTSGIELAERLASGRPRLAVIYISGYSVELMHRPPKLRDGFHFLQKPFEPGALLRLLDDTLPDSPPPPDSRSASPPRKAGIRVHRESHEGLEHGG